MDWSAIRDFLAVAETGSLSAAARQLKVSQPTLSRRIADLEESLSATLFLRTPKGLLLTETGEGMLKDARNMETLALAIERQADAGREALEGTLRVSATEGLGVKWLPKCLKSFHDRYPRLQVEILIDNRTVNLVRREADIALRLFRPEQPDLIARKIGSIHMGMYGSAAYFSQHGRPERQAELKAHRHVGFDEAMTQRADVQRLESWFSPENIVHRSNSFIGHMEAASAGIGLAMMDCYLGESAPELERVMADKLFYEMGIWLVTHAEIGRSARIRVLFDHIAEMFQNDYDLFAGKGGVEKAA